jgi:hypothetical protein
MLIYRLLHISTLYSYVAMFYHLIALLCFLMATISSCHGGMDPHCIFDGHILSQYFSCIRIVLVDGRALSHLVFRA